MPSLFLISQPLECHYEIPSGLHIPRRCHKPLTVPCCLFPRQRGRNVKNLNQSIIGRKHCQQTFQSQLHLQTGETLPRQSEKQTPYPALEQSLHTIEGSLVSRLPPPVRVVRSLGIRLLEGTAGGGIYNIE